MSPLLAAFLGMVAAVAGVLGTWLTLSYGKRKQGAEADSIQMRSALDHIGELREEIGALNATVREQRRDLDASQRRERIRNRLLVRHEIWDIRAVDALKAHGIELAPAPSLDVDEEPDPMGPRTRRDDYDAGFPTRDEFEQRRRAE